MERVFDFSGGLDSLLTQKDILPIYLTIVVGIIGHWVWEVLVAGIGTGKFDWGTAGVVIARIVIAIIAGIFSFTGIWQQLQQVDTALIFFAAFTQGFAVDALTGPVIKKAGGQQRTP